MLVESAFYKLPEILTSNFAHADTYEGTLVNSFSTCILMELNGRNIPNPFEHVHTEKPYPSTGIQQRRWRADLVLDLQGAARLDIRTAAYGVRQLNWIEVKGFFESTRSSNAPTKTAAAGRIVRDLVRLALLPEELQGRIRQNGRYLLVVFANPPRDSLSFSTTDRSRPWLVDLFSEGLSSIEIDLASEPVSLRRAVGKGFVESPALQIFLKVQTYAFEPENSESKPDFFGYLLKMKSFRISTPVGEIMYEDLPNDPWPAERLQQLSNVREEVLKRMRAEDGA